MSRRRFSSSSANSSATSAVGSGLVAPVLQPPSWPSLRTFANEFLGQKAPDWLMRWISNAASTHDAHAKERIQVERDIDSKPLEPQLSNEVGELMAAEEQAAKNGQEQKREKLTQKIDDRIRKECTSALEYIIRVHSQQREEVYRRHDKERQHLRQQLEKLTRQHLQTGIRECLSTLKSSYQANVSSPGFSSEPLPSLPRSPSNRSLTSGNDASAESRSSPTKLDKYPANFHDAEAFFREQTVDTWAQGEKFSLRCAFNNQIQRMETEWKEYLLSMEAHFAREYYSVTGCKPPECSTPATAAKYRDNKPGVSEKTWLSKEKQEQLIHTAPVLGPREHEKEENTVEGLDYCGIGISEQAAMATLRRLNSSIQTQVSDLFRRYKEARFHVLLQRNDALRWINRQCVRMLMQVDAAAVERAQVSHLQRSAMQAWDDLSVVALGIVHTMALNHSDSKRSRYNSGGADNLAKQLAQSAITGEKPSPKRLSTKLERSRSDNSKLYSPDSSVVEGGLNLRHQRSESRSRSNSRPGSRNSIETPPSSGGRRPRLYTDTQDTSARSGSSSGRNAATPPVGSRPRRQTETSSPLKVKTDCFETRSSGRKSPTRKSWHSRNLSSLG